MQQSVLFNAFNETVQVKQIIFVSAIHPIEPERQKNEQTHAFKVITQAGALWCNFKDYDSAKKVRGALDVMMDQVKGNVFKTHGETLDPVKVISFSKVFELKSNKGDATHGFFVTISTVQEKENKIWFTYKCEDHAIKGRKALYASLMEANGVERTLQPAQEPLQPTLVAEGSISYN